MALDQKQKIDELLTRGVGEFVDPDGIFRKKLENNPEKIVIKFGIDPTRPDIHLGHAVVLRKLRQFQDMGCKIIFLIGDYTAQVGDPSGKNKTRPEISIKDITDNTNTYLQQVSSLLDISDKKKYEWIANSAWYQSATDYPVGDMKHKADSWEKDRTRYKSFRQDGALPTTTLWNFMFVLKHITHANLVDRDMFQKRIKNSEHLYMHEMMYPILQGIDSDSIALLFGSCDLEVGGTDQHFNMLMGRDIMQINKKMPQAVLSFKILEGLDGKEKMSKSLDNYIGITDEASNMYGKIMSIPDSSIGNYFELCTFTAMDEVESIRKSISEGKGSPRDTKMNLAKQIVEIYHGKKEADRAEEGFVKTFQKKEIPDEIEEVSGEGKPVEILVANNIAESISVARRLFDAGAVTDMTDNKKLTQKDTFESGHVYKIGKHHFIKIR
jgi:tyrosyl-tRNA synthetase